MFELLSSSKDSGQRQKRLQRVANWCPSGSLTSSPEQNGPNKGFLRAIDLLGPEGLISHLTFVDLIFCLAVASLLIQSGEAKPGDLDTQVGKPCICNSTFYKICPPAKACVENDVLRDRPIGPTTKPPDYDYDGGPLDDMHDYDPDHVSDDMDLDPFGRPPAYQQEPPPYGGDVPPSNINGQAIPGQPDKIVRHRKVYISERKPAGPVPIIPIKIRIPVRMPELVDPVLPTPKPVYKLRKYVTYENRPEIQMVPMTKTIIKPVGVDPDQIIDESGRTTSGTATTTNSNNKLQPVARGGPIPRNAARF